jgi:c-di-GMP-binding flagellar brake protein YcgR
MERKLYRHYFGKPEPIYVALIKVGYKNLERPKAFQAKISNLSGSGASIRSKLDLPIKKNVYVTVDINMLNEKHELDAVLVRKTEHRLSTEYEYGLKFLIDRTDEDKLIRLVNKLSTAFKKD